MVDSLLYCSVLVTCISNKMGAEYLVSWRSGTVVQILIRKLVLLLPVHFQATFH